MIQITVGEKPCLNGVTTNYRRSPYQTHLVLCKYLKSFQLILVSDYVWIGGYDIYDNDTFYWLDGTPMADGYTNFCHTDGRNDNGVIILPQCGEPDWGWGDWPEDDPYYYICERDL